MGKGSSPPPAPDPNALASAQTGTNVATSIANANLGLVNQRTPWGNLDYEQTDTYSFTDPVSGKSYDIPRFTANTTLTDSQQQLFDTGQQTQQNLAGIGADQSSRIAQHLSDPFSLGESNVQAPNLRDNLPDAGPINRSYGPQGSYEGARSQVENALMERMNPYLDRGREQLEARLANQGLQPGSEMYSDAMFDFNRSENDARMNAILQAGTEQSRLAGLDASKAQFENAAQGQQFAQGLQGVDFTNQIAQQGLSNQMSIENFLADRQLQERNQPINEISALLSGSQVSNPGFSVGAPGSIPTTDYAGLSMDAYNNQYGAWRDQNNYNQQMAGSILGLGGKLIGGFF